MHAIVPGTWLSCVHPKQSQDPYGGVTIDQIAAQNIGQDTPLPSLEVAHRDRRAAAVPAIATTAAAIRAPSRSGRRPRRCRWSTTRASCSSGCSAGATPRRSARRSVEQYDSILDMVPQDAADLQRSWARATGRC